MVKEIVRSRLFNLGSIGLFGLSVVLSQMHFSSTLVILGLAVSLVMIGVHIIQWTKDRLEPRLGGRNTKMVILGLAIVAVICGGLAAFLFLAQT